MADDRKLEKTGTPGIYRRHANSCKKRGKRCKCPYIVRWKQGGRSRKQNFDTFDLAREFKGGLDSGKTTRRPLSSETISNYYQSWIKAYRGRTARGLEETTRQGYEIAFRHHILPLPIARMRLRDVSAPDVRDWLSHLEGEGASPATIRKARAAFGVMLACAVEDGDLASNPATAVRYVPSEVAKHKHPKRTRHALTPDDVDTILHAMPEHWRCFFVLLVQSGLRVSEALGLTWRHVHLGDDPHIIVAEQVYRGDRKKLKTEASMARVPLSPTMASWLADLRPDHAAADAPVFATKTGTALNYSNVYHRVLQPALRKAGIAVVIDRRKVVRRGKEVEEDVWDYQGVAFHAFRKACGRFLLHHGKTLKQVQGWLRHSQLTTTMNVYIQQVDDGLGGADVWDNILPALGHHRDTEHPETAANGTSATTPETPSESQISEQPQTRANAGSHS